VPCGGGVSDDMRGIDDIDDVAWRRDDSWWWQPWPWL
jgi:hypothetical protein